MKNSKLAKPLITSALAAMAFGAVGTAGTFALFTDKAETTIVTQAGIIDLDANVEIDDAWELYDTAMTESNGIFSNSIGGSVYVDSSKVVHLKKLAPGDGARFTINPDNSATNINTKMRLVVKMSGGLAPALVVRANVGSEEKLAFQGAKTLYTPWTSVEAFHNPEAYTLTVQFPDTDQGVINFDSSDNTYQTQEATLTVTYEVIQGNASMDDTLELINTTLINKGFANGDNKTMFDALADLTPAQVSAIRQRGYVWGVNTDQFYNFASAPADAYNYFKMYTSMPDGPSYSVYADEGWTAENVPLDGFGFDAGSVDGIANVSYTNTGTAKTVTIRTNSYATNLTIDDNTVGAVHHYGYTGSLDIIQCHTSSYHENGVVAYATVSKGRVVLEETAQVSKLHISSIKENDVTTNEFDEIIIALAEGVTKPTFSRDDVEIDAGGTLVVAIQTGTEEINDESTVDYVWLTKQGIFEQIKVSSESDSMEDAKWADASSYNGTNTQEAAYEIANNIGRNADTNKVESVVEDYTVVLDEDTRNLVVKDTNQEVIEEAIVVENVVSTAVVTTGLSEEQIEQAKTQVVETAVIGEIETKDKYCARIGAKPYETLSDAVDAAKNGETIIMTQDVTENVSINKNIVLDLDEHTINAKDNEAALTLYSLDNATVKNGTINGQVRIGEHQHTIVKWKYADQYPLYGYHPLAPAKNVELKDLEINSGAKNALYFTNIEDDLTRANESNPVDQDLYGHYLYKTGYQTYEDSVYPDRSKTFTACEDKDKVTVTNCDISASTSLVGNMHDINGNLYTEVLDIKSGEFSNDSLGRFVSDGKFLVGQSASTYIVADQAPSDYYGKVNDVYYCFVGGANKAIAYANFGETVYIKENADQEKVFSEDKNGHRDELVVVYEAPEIAYTGAVPFSENYDIMIEVDGNSNLFYAAFTPVAAVYATGQGGNWKTATKVGEYGSLKEAFDGLPANYTVVIMKDFSVGDESTYYYGGTNYKCAVGYAQRSTIDFNGHVITYTGTGYCIISSQSSGYLYIKDASGTNAGGITVTGNNAGCFGKFTGPAKTNTKITDRNYFSGGTFTSKNRAPMYFYGGCYIEMSGGVYVWTGSANISQGFNCKTLSIIGGKYSKEPNSSFLGAGYKATQGDDGMWTVHN